MQTDLDCDADAFISREIGMLDDPQKDLPRIARDMNLVSKIESLVRQLPSRHDLYCRDARTLEFLKPGSVHLILTSPPYWTLKEYNVSKGQLGYITDYEEFLGELDKVWRHC